MARRRLRPEERTIRTLERMVPGTVGGRLESAAPPAAKETLGRAKVGGGGTGGWDVVFHQTGTVALSPSNVPRFHFPQAVARLDVAVSAAAAGSGSTVVTLYKNGSSIGTVTLTSADLYEAAIITAAFATTDYLTAKVTTANGHSEMVVMVRGT